MAKFNNNIVDVWTWLANWLTSGELSATEQLVLIHLTIAINRNVWKDTKYNPKMIAAAIGKDNRTVNSAIKRLAQLNIINISEGGFNVNNKSNGNVIYRTDYCSVQSQIQQPFNSGRVDESDVYVATTSTASRKRSIFTA